MKKWTRIFVVATCACLAFVLMACDGGSTENKEKASVSDSRGPFYVLIVGNDSRVGTVDASVPEYADGSARSDTMMLSRIDPATYAITLVTVPRDTTSTYQGSTMKLNEVYQHGGIEALVSDVETLTGLRIDYYLDMSFVQFSAFVDELDGVQVNVPISLSIDDIIKGGKVQLEAGDQALDGSGALGFARSRSYYANDLDACRQIQDRQLVEVGVKKVLGDPVRAASSAGTLIDNMETNWDTNDLVDLVVDFVENSEKVTILSGTGPYLGDIDPVTELWMIPRDETAWRQLMAFIDAGGDPQSVVALPEVQPKL